MMQITLLGTGSPIPDPNRAGPSTLVRGDGVNLLADCGRGVLMRLAAAGVLPPMLHALLVTHLHSDHLTDLNDVVTTHWVMNAEPSTLRLFGPPGLGDVVDATLGALAPDIRYRLAHHDDLTWPPMVDVAEVAPGDRFEVGSAQVSVAATDHRPVEPTVAYRIEGDGHSVVLGGDGVPCEGLDELCTDADVYVQTVIRDDLVRQVPNARFQDIVDYHSTVEDAARTAARAGVGTLVLTHYVPPMAPDQADDWRALTVAHFTGEIVLGDDLTTVSL
ncbi:MAG TPA: ribonuclease Z [Acidimicrobiia bacterium]|nr:ribonuclease Z [Acidimicrobiia bacterium]